MRVPGITNADMSWLINETLKYPEWEYIGQTGGTHGQIKHTPSGAVVRFGTTPGLNSWKTVAKQIQQIGGRSPRRQAKHGRGKGTVRQYEDVPVSEKSRREAERRVAERERRKAIEKRERELRDIRRLMGGRG